MSHYSNPQPNMHESVTGFISWQIYVHCRVDNTPTHTCIVVHHLHFQSGSIVFAKCLNNVKRSSAPAYSNLTFSKFQGWEDFVEFMEISLLNWFLIPRSLNFLQIGNIIHRRMNFASVSSSDKIQHPCCLFQRVETFLFQRGEDS